MLTALYTCVFDRASVYMYLCVHVRERENVYACLLCGMCVCVCVWKQKKIGSRGTVRGFVSKGAEAWDS